MSDDIASPSPSPAAVPIIDPRSPLRRIFRYNDGVRDVWADPSCIKRSFYAVAALDPEAFARAYNEAYGSVTRFGPPPPGPGADDPPEARAEALERQSAYYQTLIAAVGAARAVIIPAVRTAFAAPAVDPATGTGLTEDDCLLLLEDFFRWEQQVKKNTATPPSPSAPTPDLDPAGPGTSPGSSGTASN